MVYTTGLASWNFTQVKWYSLHFYPIQLAGNYDDHPKSNAQ
jgi:hypothetical protein